ncbi:MAG: hypothetical protein NWR72_20080 [Bacteroidia bacterium]|nr:hypothetical protein [Bacteroidia bacterium]
MKNVVISGLLILLLLGSSCKEEIDADIADIELDVKVVRVDSLMYAFGKAIREEDSLEIWDAFERFVAPQGDFFAEYLFLPPGINRSPRLRDSIMTAMLGQALKDGGLFELVDTIRQTFPYEVPLAARIEAPLKRLVKYFPDITLPEFRAHVNGYPADADWNSVDQIASYPGFISFGLHYFMGKNWPMYPPGIFAYQRRRLTPDYFGVCLTEQIAEELVTPIPMNQQVPLLHKVVRAGIKQYVVHQLLPYTPDSLLLHYTSEQMDWANLYESANYKLIMPSLYETDMAPEQDFLSDKAFTSDLSRESAPRIGEYVGWKIVSLYMDKHPEITLPDLCELVDYELIVREARYKP